MKKIRNQFVFVLISAIAIILICLGLIVQTIVNNYSSRLYQEQLIREADFILSRLEVGEGWETFDAKLLKDAGRHLRAGFHLYDQTGNKIYESDEIPHIDEEALGNIIERANEEPAGFLFSDNQKKMVYWKMFEFNGEMPGLFIISQESGGIHSVNIKIWFLFFLSLAAAFLIILYLGKRFKSKYIIPVESVTKAVKQLADGNFQARTYEPSGELKSLSTSVNILARNIQQLNTEQEMRTEQLLTIIENMGSGLILIDDRGYIQLTNQAFKEAFYLGNQDIIGRSYLDIITHEEIIDCIGEVFMTEQNIRKQVVVPVQIYRKHFEIYGAPIISRQNEWNGIVLVFHDITELKKLEKVRKDFVANVSHELKTPVTSLKGFTETLLDGAMNDERALKNFLTIIHKESARLQSLINDLLELSKIEQVGFTLNLKNVNLGEIIFDVVNMLENQAKKKQIKITLPERQIKIVEGDPLRIKQIFINLINNAITYTPEKGEVHIKVEEHEDYVETSVKDNGIGIEKKEIPRIFERFYRVDKARSRNSGGTGLGLAIVKHLVEAHHGEIYVESIPGKGSTFTVKLRKSFQSKYGSSGN